MEKLVGEKFKYIDRAKDFVEEALDLKSGQTPMYNVIYFMKVLHKKDPSSY